MNPSRSVEIGRLIRFVEAQGALHRAKDDRGLAELRYAEAEREFHAAWKQLKPAEQKLLNTFYEVGE